MNSITIKGMACEHCRKASTEALRELGLENVNVDLASGVATFSETQIHAQRIKDAIDDAGFEVISYE